MTCILDGKQLSQKIRAQIREELALQSGSSKPHLVVLVTYPHPASEIYVRNKMSACQEVGIRTTIVEQPCSSDGEVLALLDRWNHDPDVDGILVQFPVHPSVHQHRIMSAVNPAKDVDGTHPENLGRLVLGSDEGFIPCTPRGIQTLLHAYEIPVKGKHVVIIGRSCTVGKPLGLLLTRVGADATVTIANRSTRDLATLCLSGDILVAAAGSPGLITPSMVREGAVVIDVGINRVTTGDKVHVVGDVDFERAKGRCAAITPVPGGVGPMTIASLLQNTVRSYRRRCASSSLY